VITMDNYFTSIGLFKALLERGIYATGTLRNNRIGIPSDLKNTKTFIKSAQGTLEWRMHESRRMSSIIWKDKRPVLLLSTHAPPIQFPWEFPVVIVPRRNGADREHIQTSPVHLEYTTHMRGVDVADQLRASYCSQNRSHKWWHRVFLFLVDMSIVNMFIIYVDECKNDETPRRPMTHMQFRMELCKSLLRNWRGKNHEEARPSNGYCYPTTSELRGVCVVCNDGVTRPYTYCRNCGRRYMCFYKGCFQQYHDSLLPQTHENVSEMVHVFVFVGEISFVIFLANVETNTKGVVLLAKKPRSLGAWKKPLVPSSTICCPRTLEDYVRSRGERSISFQKFVLFGFYFFLNVKNIEIYVFTVGIGKNNNLSAQVFLEKLPMYCRFLGHPPIASSF
jgi:hypothetical protein